MKKHISIILAMTVGVVCAPAAFAQSIGVSFISDTNTDSSSGVNGANNNFPDAMLPADMAGVAPYAQTNWNNFGARGSGNVILTNSAGVGAPFAVAWDSGHCDSTGSGAGLGTGDGKLMDGFVYSWGPGAATTLGGSVSVSSSGINNQPLTYIRGLNSWYISEGAEGYTVVLYTSGYSFFDTGAYWIQAVSGDPLATNMVGGADLTVHLFENDQQPFIGTYNQVTSVNVNSPTVNGNYAVFAGLTNDAVLIRVNSPGGGYSPGLDGFQFIPVFPAVPTVTAPTITPSDTVFAEVPVTLTEVATGDPFHPALFYQWQSDNGSGGPATNNILDATNATLTVTPTNNVSAYGINYQVIVTNFFGPATSSVVTLTVNPAVAPFVTQDTTPGAGNGAAGVFAYVGGTVSFSAAFGGTPGTYLWQSNSVNIPNATTTTLTLANVQLSTSASYALTATNSIDGTVSTPSSLTVLADLAAPDASVPYAYDVFTNSPAAYWRLGETADNIGNSIQAYDYSGHGFDATYGNGAADNTAGPQSPAFSGFEADNTAVALVNGADNSFLTAPSLNLNANTVTITAWINPSSGQANFNGLFMWANGSDKAGFGFGGNSSGGMAELGYTWDTNSPSTFNFHSGLYPLAGQWSFVALTITPTNSTIYLYYIDGNTGITNLLKSVQTINNIPEPFSGGTTWIGSDTSAGRNFGGSIDEVSVFGRSLSEAQVQDLFLKAIGAPGVAPTLSSTTASPSVPVYSGQNVLLSVTNVSGTVPLNLQWQAGPDGSTWTNVPGAVSSTFLANPLAVGTVYYQLVASNAISSATNVPTAVVFNALPASPAGLWTANFQITNNVLNFTTGGGVGHYVGRGILGTGMFWNVLPDTAGSFGFVSRIDSVSDLQDNGTAHSGVTCSIFNALGFSSATTVLPLSDIGNLLYQYVTITSSPNALQFHGVPDGTYNLAIYACDGNFGDRGSSLVVHDSLNGDQTQGTVNAAPIAPLNQGVNFVLFTGVHVSGGTLNVDVNPNSPLPTHDPNTEADINAAQLQLVSYDLAVAGFSGAPRNIFATQTVTFTDASTGGITNWIWNFGDGSSVTNASNASVNHAYAAAGSYTVSLIVNGGGSSTNTQASYIVVKSKPSFGAPVLSNGSLILGGANGPVGQQYRILTSTNVALALANWVPVWTNVIAADGSYGYTNSSLAGSGKFFILVSP